MDLLGVYSLPYPSKRIDNYLLCNFYNKNITSIECYIEFSGAILSVLFTLFNLVFIEKTNTYIFKYIFICRNEISGSM